MERDENQLQGAGTGAAIVADVALSEKKKEARLPRYRSRQQTVMGIYWKETISRSLHRLLL